MKERWLVATRKSPLAVAQTRATIALLSEQNPGLVFEEHLVVTSGDRFIDRSLREIGGKGLFVKEIEEALVEGRADLAIHSMKDLPEQLLDGLVIAGIPVREDPRDAVVTRAGELLEALPSGSKLGTTSLRRQLQLLAWRSDFAFHPLRGNVDTRLKRLDEGSVDAVILARAGLSRLDLLERATEILSTDRCLPAAGQGALAIECRQDDSDARQLVGKIHDAEVGLRIAAERGVLLALGGGCDVPVAALSEREGENMRLRGFFANPQTGAIRRAERWTLWPASELEAAAFGMELGKELTAKA